MWQWQGTCLTQVGPWILSPAPKKGDRGSQELGTYNVSAAVLDTGDSREQSTAPTAKEARLGTWFQVLGREREATGE